MAPWERPPDLERGLAVLETLWRDKRQPIYVWTAMRHCLAWPDAEGRRLRYQYPMWVDECLLGGCRAIEKLVEGGTPTNAELGAALLDALGFAAKGRQLAAEWVDDHIEMMTEVALVVAKSTRTTKEEFAELIAAEAPRPVRRTQEVDGGSPKRAVLDSGRRGAATIRRIQKEREPKPR